MNATRLGRVALVAASFVVWGCMAGEDETIAESDGSSTDDASGDDVPTDDIDVHEDIIVNASPGDPTKVVGASSSNSSCAPSCNACHNRGKECGGASYGSTCAAQCLERAKCGPTWMTCELGAPKYDQFYHSLPFSGYIALRWTCDVGYHQVSCYHSNPLELD